MHPRVVKQLQRLQRSGRQALVDRIRTRLDRLEDDPRSPRSGLDVQPVSGTDRPLYRLRVGDHRLIYEPDDDERTVYVTTLSGRGRAYR